ncbi:MAG TPA: hypothetical protein VFY17_04570 [Pilimelia sp.]|nr:hypothetical protein [Pilimelia sp.]
MGAVEDESRAVDALFAAPPEQFVAGRNTAVAAAKAAGDPGRAQRLAALRRPTVAAWLVNLLALGAPDALAALEPLADRLRAAQRTGDGEALRALATERRRLVGALVRRAAELAGAAGAARPSATVLSEVESTLHAALVDREVAARVRAGRLTRAADYAGFADASRPPLRVVPGTGPTGRTTPPVGRDRTASGRGPRGGTPPPSARTAADSAPTGAGSPADGYARAMRELVEARAAEEAADAALAALDRRLAALRRETADLQARRGAAVAERDAARAARRAAQRHLSRLD